MFSKGYKQHSNLNLRLTFIFLLLFSFLSFLLFSTSSYSSRLLPALPTPVPVLTPVQTQTLNQDRNKGKVEFFHIVFIGEIVFEGLGLSVRNGIVFVYTWRKKSTFSRRGSSGNQVSLILYPDCVFLFVYTTLKKPVFVCVN